MKHEGHDNPSIKVFILHLPNFPFFWIAPKDALKPKYLKGLTPKSRGVVNLGFDMILIDFKI